MLGRAPDPARAAKLSKATIAAASKRGCRRAVEAKAAHIQSVLRARELRQLETVALAHTAVVVSQVRRISAVLADIEEMEQMVGQGFSRHPEAEIYLSQPGLGPIPGARLLGEFGDAPKRYADVKARKNYAGTSPITRASGKKKVVLARYARNRRLGDAVHQWAFCALKGSPGARTYYKALRERKIGHSAALRQLANSLVGILHGCLKTGTLYNEQDAWAHHLNAAA